MPTMSPGAATSAALVRVRHGDVAEPLLLSLPFTWSTKRLGTNPVGGGGVLRSGDEVARSGGEVARSGGEVARSAGVLEPMSAGVPAPLTMRTGRLVLDSLDENAKPSVERGRIRNDTFWLADTADVTSTFTHVPDWVA